MLRGLVRPFHKEVPSITAYSSNGRNTTINIRGLGTGVAGSAQPVSTPVSASTSTTCITVGSANLWSQNLSDQLYFLSKTVNEQTGRLTGLLGDPRTFGDTFRYFFD
jgi:hypothetical protein